MTGVDMDLTYTNPVNLPHMEVLTQPREMAPTDEGVADVTTGMAEVMAKPEWLPADGRSLVRQSKTGFSVVSENAFRTAADFSAVNVDGTIYLYASGALNNEGNSRVVWSTTDYLTWTPHEMNIGLTAPTVVHIGDKFYMAGNSTPFYVADSPVGPWTELGRPMHLDGTELRAGDVQFFKDTDGRLYLNYNIGEPIMGVELDAADPLKVLTEPVVLWDFDPAQEWQHFGDNKQSSAFGYVEGGQMFKVGDTYYMSVASGGTEHTTYATGVISSTSPLEGYSLPEGQVNPIGYGPQGNYPSGVHPNAGHGSFVVDDSGNVIFFYTYVIAYETGFERRLGMDVCEVGSQGALSCELSNTPQLAPGHEIDGQRDVGLYGLSTLTSAYWTSSFAPGRTPYYGTDRSLATWWQPEDTDAAPTYITGFANPYYISAAQIQWKEIGHEYTEDNAVQYTLEYRDIDSNSWQPLVDRSGNTTPYTADYVTFDRVLTHAVRLTITGTTEDVTVGIAELNVFGENHTLALERGILDEPTEEPTTNQPTEEPTTNQPTEEPTTNQPTEEPTTNQPTVEPTTNQPTVEPTTGGSAPTGAAPNPPGGGGLPSTGAGGVALGTLGALALLAAGGVLVSRRRSTS
ncbi:family 43 glycosylhydrolase [Georgenia faecalis]|uniref:family 43 glycosylhydrolase n=1 Tax=Georgenia faecalis TaxID=2483799 RepID=UPI0013DF1442|nr:family 43 glycosylhydrolase [Georgenia faecalis]